MTWLWEDGELTDELVKGHAGMVYVITSLETGRLYIGRKYFTSKRKPKKGGRRKTRESDWRDYFGSSATLLADVERLGPEKFERRALSLHATRGDTNAAELRTLWTLNAHENSSLMNDSIGTRRAMPVKTIEARKHSKHLRVLMDKHGWQTHLPI